MNAREDILLLDGATGTELDRRGIDVGLPLWSARAIIDAPDVLGEVHQAYLKAGAQVITANTFRTHRRSLEKAGLGSRAQRLTEQAVSIAIEQRDLHAPAAGVYGSVSPLEDCYSPELCPPEADCQKEHGEMIRCLVDAGVDLVLVETMCSTRETLAAIEAAQEHAPDAWAVSFCLDIKAAPGTLLDGTSLESLVPHLSAAEFVGINCVAATAMQDQVRHLRTLLPPHVRIAAYGNVGHPDDSVGWINTDAVDPGRYAEHAMDWIDAGATIVGGCCGTTPSTTRAIGRSLGR